MAGFGLPQVGDFHTRTQQAMSGAQGAAGGMLDKYNIDSRNALAAQEMALDEAYRRDALMADIAYNDRYLSLNDRKLDQNEPGLFDNMYSIFNTGVRGFELLDAADNAGWLDTAGDAWSTLAELWP